MKSERITAFIILFAIICFSSVPVFSAAPESINSQFTGGGTASLVIESEEKLPPNGEYVISVMRDGEWVEAGSAGFNKFPGERQLYLGKLVSGEETVRVRIAQSGGGAAYIDSVFLNGQAPTAVNGSDELFLGSPLYKLRSKDLDLIDAGADGIELEFPSCAGEAILRITARIESPVPGGEPFQFPRGNLFAMVDEHSHFYSYRADSISGALNIDGQPDEVNGVQPFLKEYCVPSSGHPEGFMYFWVMNDDDNLYVAMDVTPDNTMDGDADYAKVYVKTPGGLKEFKVSVPETQWGTPGFIYTDRAAYQHKVYEFSIPLEQIGIDDVHNADEISLAFSIYGTASVSKHKPSVVYDSQNRRFISVYVYYFYDYGEGHTVYKVLGGVVDHDGNVIESEIPIYEPDGIVSEPSIAYDNTNGRCLVVWTNDIYSQYYSVSGKMVDSEEWLIGSGVDPIGEEISVYEDVYGYSADRPSVAFDASNGTYLVVWHEYDWGDRNSIVGQLLRSNGEKIGAPITISDEYACPESPSVASTGDGQFLVVWHDYRGDSPKIFAQLVDVNDFDEGGFQAEENIMVSTEPGNHKYPAVAYDNINDQFLVAFVNEDSSGEVFSILGQRVDGNGSIEGMDENFMILGDTYNALNPAVSFDSYNEKFLVTWDQKDNVSDWCSNVFGRFVNADGGLSGEEFNISGYYTQHSMPSIAYNSNHSGFVVGYVENNDGETMDIYKQVPPVPNPEILYADGLISPGLAKYDLSDPETGEIRVDLEDNGNVLYEIVCGYESLTSAEDDPDDYDYLLDNAPYRLERDGEPYNKFFSQYRVFLQPSLFSEMQPGDCAVLTFYFSGGVSTELHVAVVESSDEDTTGPTTVDDVWALSLGAGQSISVVFNESLHEHSRHAIEDAIMDNISTDDEEFICLDIDWTPDNRTVTVTNTSDECSSITYFFENNISVDIMDFAGNTANETIIFVGLP